MIHIITINKILTLFQQNSLGENKPVITKRVLTIHLQVNEIVYGYTDKEKGCKVGRWMYNGGSWRGLRSIKRFMFSEWGRDWLNQR